MITITHTPAEGTLVAGMVRGDGTYEILTANGFKRGRSIGTVFVPHSRDRAPKLRLIERAIAALEAAGHEVEADIDTMPRDAAAADADRRDRLADRADALTAKAGRLGAQGAALEASAKAVYDSIPFGQPVLTDHYSYASDRNRRERAWKKLGKGYALQADAEQVAKRADVAHHHATASADPRATMRKIERLTADINRYRRALNGEVAPRNAYYGDTATPATGTYRAELESLIAHAERDRDYAKAQLDAAKAAGAKVYGPDDFDKAQVKAGRVAVKCWAGGPDGYAKVTRVNAKSLTVLRNPREGVTWPEAMPYDKVFGIRVGEVPHVLPEIAGA